MYNNNYINIDSDYIREPIPQKIDKINKESQYQMNKFKTEMFSTSSTSLFYYDPQQLTTTHDSTKQLTKREKLLQPPIELIFKGNFDQVCQRASDLNKWLIVSIHNNEVFECHLLNRDLWKYSPMQQLMKTHFIFWPVLYNSIEAQQFLNWYPYDNRNAHIAILDPTTRESKRLFIGNAIENKEIMVKYFQEFLQSNETSNSRLLREILGKKIKNTEISENFIKNNESISQSDCNEKWQDYLGNNNDMKYTMLVMKNNYREKITMPSTSRLKALWLFLIEKGNDMKTLKLFRSYEKLTVDKEMLNETLECCGIRNMDTFHLIDID